MLVSSSWNLLLEDGGDDGLRIGCGLFATMCSMLTLEHLIGGGRKFGRKSQASGGSCRYPSLFLHFFRLGSRDELVSARLNIIWQPAHLVCIMTRALLERPCSPEDLPTAHELSFSPASSSAYVRAYFRNPAIQPHMGKPLWCTVHHTRSLETTSIACYEAYVRNDTRQGIGATCIRGQKNFSHLTCIIVHLASNQNFPING